MSAPQLSSHARPYTSVFILLASLFLTGCGFLPFAPSSGVSVLQTATPTECGCQVDPVATPSPGTSTFSLPPPSQTPDPGAENQATRPPRLTVTGRGVGSTETDLVNTPAQGRVIAGEMATSLLKQPLSFLIYLPPGYSDQDTIRYPVLYLLHGQDLKDDQWVRLGVNATADRLQAAGEIPPMIIVMPEEVDTVALPENTDFGHVVATALVQWIDSHYLTRADRADRAIGGLSRGASWAVRLGLIYWQTFGAIGAHSFPEFLGDGFLIPKWLAVIPPDVYPRIYLDIGNKDPGLKLVQDFEVYLTGQGIPHEFHMFTGYHDETYWQAHIEDYLLWYTANW